MLKPLSLTFACLALSQMLLSCAANRGTQEVVAGARTETVSQFVQFADGLHRYKVPPAFRYNYEPAYRLGVYGYVYRGVGGHLMIDADPGPVRFNPIRFRSGISVSITRAGMYGCHADQSVLSKVWKGVSSWQTDPVSNPDLVGIDTAPVDCQYRSLTDRVRKNKELETESIRQYIGVLSGERLFYMACNEDEDPRGKARCLLETDWRSADLTMSFGAEYKEDWRSMVGLAEEWINAMYVSAFSYDEISADKLDVVLMRNNVSLQIPARFVKNVRGRGQKAGETRKSVMLQARLSESGKKLIPEKGGHESAYRQLGGAPDSVRISISAPSSVIGQAEFENVTKGLKDWSAVTGSFNDAQIDPDQAVRVSLKEDYPNYFEYLISVSGEVVGQLNCHNRQVSREKVLGICSHFVKRDGFLIEIETNFDKGVDLAGLYLVIDGTLSGFDSSAETKLSVR